MQEFLKFVNKIHDLGKCIQGDCEVKSFLVALKDDIFNEELSYDS